MIDLWALLVAGSGGAGVGGPLVYYYIKKNDKLLEDNCKRHADRMDQMDVRLNQTERDIGSKLDRIEVQAKHVEQTVYDLITLKKLELEGASVEEQLIFVGRINGRKP